MLKKIIAYTLGTVLLMSSTVYADDTIHYETENSIIIDHERDNTHFADDEMIFIDVENEENENSDEYYDCESVDDIVEEEEITEDTDLELFYGKQNLLKVQVTCYIEPGKPTCTGSYRMDGAAAGRKEWLGRVGLLYHVNEDGTLGEYFDTVIFNDIGYGAPVGYGTKSDLFKNRSAGTIETGKTIDIRRPDISSCKEYMLDTYTGGGTTGSEVYMQLIDGNG